jgi:hypothetical protein
VFASDGIYEGEKAQQGEDCTDECTAKPEGQQSPSRVSLASEHLLDPHPAPRAMSGRMHNTEISSEDRAVRAVAGFVCFISLFDGRSI